MAQTRIVSPDSKSPARDRLHEPAPRLDVRVVLFTAAGGTLLLTLENYERGLRLPAGAPLAAEPFDIAARRIARESTALREQYLEQLYTLSLTDSGGWMVVVSYMALLSSSGSGPVPGEGASWYAVDSLPTISAPDQMVIDYALVRLRAKLGYTTVAFHLLPPTFTLTELQGAYETILGHPLDKRNFRRRVIAAGILARTDTQRRQGSHRPAALYRFHSLDDREAYLTPLWAERS